MNPTPGISIPSTDSSFAAVDPESEYAPGDTIIRVRNLVAGYEESVILNDISFDVRAGEVFVILGGSGCGKSTLLKHMIGLNEPFDGSVEIAGHEITRSGIRAGGHGLTRREITRTFGVMYQSGALFGSMTVLENVQLPLEEFTALSPSAISLVARMKLKLVGLEGFEDYLPSEISGGMKKRAAIARAMALDPRILFLDEPSAGLDPITSAELDELILQLAKNLGITFVVVTHELASIFKIADRVIMLDKRARGIVATGSPADLRDHSDNPWVRQFFHRTAQPTP